LSFGLGADNRWFAMNRRRWTNLITVLLIGLLAIGGFWLWDARNYPMAGIPKAPPAPFAHPNWDWSESLVTNLSRIQDKLQSRRYGRLKEKWIRGLELADTYWVFRGGKYAIHFGEDGNLGVKKSAQNLSDEIEDFRSYKRTHDKEIILYSERDGNGDSTVVSISAINEDSIMLVAEGIGPLAVIDRATSASHFDGLAH
jgi:hypothetical protein